MSEDTVKMIDIKKIKQRIENKDIISQIVGISEVCLYNLWSVCCVL